MSDLSGNIEATYKPITRRKRYLALKHTLEAHNTHRNTSDHIKNDGNDYEGDASLRSRSKKYEHKRNRKLLEKHNVQRQTIEDGDNDSGITSLRAGDKRLSKDILKSAKEYHKLEKHYENVREECQKLSILLEKREAEYKTVCLHNERLVQVVQVMEEAKANIVKHYQELEAEKYQSNEDIGLLKDIVCQLNAELERYQDKLKEKKLENGSIGVENTGRKDYPSSKSWGGISFHALAPLLNAYQENLTEKRELVNMYEQEMADFSSRCKEVLAENELMHKEVEELKVECSRYENGLKTVVENTTTLKKQNNILLKENIDLKREMNDIRSSYEMKIEVILKHNEALRKENSTCSLELNNLRGKYEILSKEFEKMKSKEDQTIPTIVHTSAIEECKTLLEELKHRYESEKRNLSNQIKRIEENQPENERQLIMVMAERNHFKSLVESLEKNLRRTQRKAEHMRSLVHTTRVLRDSLKDQLNKATAYCEELFSEYERIAAEREKLLTLLRETEKENASIDRLGKSITSRVEGLKDQLETVRKGAKQQVATVEKRIKLQELKVRQMKREYRSKVQYLRDTIKQKEETIKSLQKEKQSSQNDTIEQVLQTVGDEKSEGETDEEKDNNV